MTNETRVWIGLTNERRVWIVLTNRRRVLPEDHLPAVSDRVPDGQGEGDGAPQAGEHHHVLEVGGDLDTPLDVQDG